MYTLKFPNTWHLIIPDKKVKNVLSFKLFIYFWGRHQCFSKFTPLGRLVYSVCEEMRDELKPGNNRTGAAAAKTPQKLLYIFTLSKVAAELHFSPGRKPTDQLHFLWQFSHVCLHFYNLKRSAAWETGDVLTPWN